MEGTGLTPPFFLKNRKHFLQTSINVVIFEKNLERVINIKNTHWVAAYTKPRNEKKVYERLIEQGIETYLPLQKRLKKWSDRKKWVEEPLIRSYIFIKICEKDYYKTLNTPGLVRYVTFEGKAAVIPDKQINLLKMLLGQQVDLEVLDENIAPGDKVEIIIGSMMGFVGEVVKHKGKEKAIIQIDHISHAILVTLPKNYLTRSLSED